MDVGKDTNITAAIQILEVMISKHGFKLKDVSQGKQVARFRAVKMGRSPWGLKKTRAWALFFEPIFFRAIFSPARKSPKKYGPALMGYG